MYRDWDVESPDCERSLMWRKLYREGEGCEGSAFCICSSLSFLVFDSVGAFLSLSFYLSICH